MGVTLHQFEAAAGGFPGAVESTSYGNRCWKVGTAKRQFAWIRPLSKADVKRWGSAPLPDGDLVALAVEDLADKEAVLAAGHEGVFTIEHFEGHPAILVELDVVDPEVFAELLEDAWLAIAPEALKQGFLGDQ